MVFVHLLSSECPANSYGEACQFVCDCIHGMCHHVTGMCHCMDGYTGMKCETSKQFFLCLITDIVAI